MPPQPGAIQVTDRLERRIRKPIDLLRCITSFIEIVVLAVAGVAASATTTGVETDITGASARLPSAVLSVAPPLALFAILIIPLALAVRQLIRRQVQRLAEAVATGVLAGVAAAVTNVVLYRGFAERLYDAIIMSRPGASHAAALDPYLAGLVAYATIIGLSGRPGWRNALWLAVGVYALVHLAALDTTILSLLITLLVGRTIGLGVRYVAGSPSLRPSATEIATALNSPDRQVVEMYRLGNGVRTPEPAGSRH
jgi:glycosyltransferase 2 family protein